MLVSADVSAEGRPVAVPGDRSTAVAQVAGWLVQLGLLPPEHARDTYDEELGRAVRAFQQSRRLRADGVVGPETFHALEGARWELGARVLQHRVSHPYTGGDVVALQLRLAQLGFDVGRCDGVFAGRTEAALRDFQRNYGLTPDGTVGPATVRALRQIRRSVTAGSSHELREAEALRRRGPALAGKRIVIDSAYGGAYTGHVGNGLVERDVTADLAARVEGRLAAAGAAAFLTHGPDLSPPDAERARFANDSGADLLISLHCDAARTATAHGVATYYYGTGPDSGSVPGERLAGLLHREVVARTGLADNRTHPVTWELLRRTRMPAVHVDLGYLTHPGDAALLADTRTRDTIAEAVVVAIQRVFLPDEQDPPTGALDLSSLRR